MNNTTYALVITIACHSVVIGMSWLISFVCCAEWWWLWCMYCFSTLVAWYIHRLGHKTSNGANVWWKRVRKSWFDAHTVAHHTRYYPLKRFVAETVLDSDSPNAPYYYPIFIIVVSVSLLLRGLVAGIVIGLLFYLAAMITDGIHTEYHLTNSWLNKYRWFIVLREIHVQHHDLKKDVNYSVIDTTWDIVMGTFSAS